MSKKLEEYTKEELIEAVKHLKRRKRFGLVWENKLEDVVKQCQLELPVLEEVEDRAVSKNEELATDLIIEGDNYHALSVLNYTHGGKIDAIYIDPPYNTGAKDWTYNNNYVDSEDPYRHTKWISFMEHRLRLSRSLLAPDGMICVTIDDYEFPRLVMLMDEIFGEQCRLGTAVIRNNPQGRSTVKGFSINHEYALFYGRSIKSRVGRLPRSEKQMDRYPEIDEKGQNYLWENFRKTGSDSSRQDRPKQFYPLYISGKNIRLPKMEWEDDKKAWKVKEAPADNEVELWPVDNLKNERVWKWGYERVLANPTHLRVRKTTSGKFEVYRRNYPSEGSLPNTLWDKPQYAAGSHGTNLLTKMFSKSHIFDFPKSLYAVQDCIRVCSSKKDAIVLDYFAGSGTTGHAILRMNQEDGGNRSFILCTNNENKIAEEVTYPRIKKVIDGYDSTKGIPANIRYFRTSFVTKSTVTDDTRYQLVRRSSDMLCVREGTYTTVIDKPGYKVFENSNHYTAILFDIDMIQDLKETLKSLSNKSISFYVFTLTNDTYDDDFADVSQPHKLCPIPESILDVYRKIFKERPEWN